MRTLYKNYYSQAAYRNTFLVNSPHEIARATGSDTEWNNIEDSGCHFTCLAMIAGIDPAAFATALTQSRGERPAYFTPDSDLPAKTLSGANCALVWDQNHPSKRGSSVETGAIWHPAHGRRVKIHIECVEVHRPTSASASVEVAIEALARGNHVVCGPDSHSVLVAGLGNKGPFIWDPDQKKSLGSMIAGNLSLVDYAKSLGRKKFILHEYFCSAA